MERTPEAVESELSPQLTETAEREIAIWRATLLASTAARTGFHEKLVVITAGSLTIVVTMAANIYVKPFPERLLNHRLLEGLAISAILLFLSLIASVIHNFLETEALHLELLAEEKGIPRRLLQAIVNEQSPSEEVKRLVRESVDTPFAAAQADKIRKVSSLRLAERWVGRFAVISFALGYAPAIAFVVYLARV